MRALITGDLGFVGRHLRELLQNEGHEVFGLDIKNGDDIRDYETVRARLDEQRPHMIFHLAAQAYVPESFIEPQRAIDINVTGSLNIFEAVRRLGIKTKIMVVGTSEEYGDSSDLLTVTERTLPHPLSPYAISKLAMDHFAQLYAQAYSLHIVVTRAFNHTGPGRGEMYAEGSFAKQIVEIERGERSHLEHGNLSSIRNYTDVRDIVRAYRLAIDLPSDVYNICSDENVSINVVLDKLRDLSTAAIPTLEDPNLYRPVDFSFKEPSCAKFRALTGWEPRIPLTLTLSDMLDEWRSQS